MAQKMNSKREQEDIRKVAAKLWHEEVLPEQASKQKKQRQEQPEQQKRINQKKVYAKASHSQTTLFIYIGMPI